MPREFIKPVGFLTPGADDTSGDAWWLIDASGTGTPRVRPWTDGVRLILKLNLSFRFEFQGWSLGLMVCPCLHWWSAPDFLSQNSYKP